MGKGGPGERVTILLPLSGLTATVALAVVSAALSAAKRRTNSLVVGRVSPSAPRLAVRGRLADGNVTAKGSAKRQHPCDILATPDGRGHARAGSVESTQRHKGAKDARFSAAWHLHPLGE